MWVFNKPGKSRGHIYDLFSALAGFKEIQWEEIPRPFTGDYFDGKTVVYWRSSFFQPMNKWNKDVIDDPEKNFRENLFTIFGHSRYRLNIWGTHDPYCDYNILTDNEDIYKLEMRNINKIMRENEELAKEIQSNVQRLTYANPDVSRTLAKYKSIPITETARLELIKSLPPEERRKELEGWPDVEKASSD
jgi:hypothetical protein